MYFGYNPVYPNPYAMKMNTMNQMSMINSIRPMNPITPIQPINQIPNIPPQPVQTMAPRNTYAMNRMSYPINQPSINSSSNNLNKQRNRFSKEEDECLRILVEEQDENIDWNYISSKMAGRTSRQCRERYRNYLRPNLENGSWTEEEDDLLEQMYEKYGPQWSKIANFFPKRSDVNIKNHHTCIINRLSRQRKKKNNGRSSTKKDMISTMNIDQPSYIPQPPLAPPIMQQPINQMNMPVANPVMDTVNPMMMNPPPEPVCNSIPMNVNPIPTEDPPIIPQPDQPFENAENTTQPSSPDITLPSDSSTSPKFDGDIHHEDGDEDFFNKIDFTFGEFKFDDFTPQGELSPTFGNLDFVC